MAGHTKLDDESPVVLPTNISASEEGGDITLKAKGAEHGNAVAAKLDGKSGIAGAVFNLANAVSVQLYVNSLYI